jgi:hypothetical protein
MSAEIVNLTEKFRQRARRQEMTIDVIRLAIDLYAREQLGIDEDAPYSALELDDHDALAYLKNAFRSRIAAELIAGGSAAEQPVAHALLADFSI